MIDLAIITPPETFPYQHPTLFTARPAELELWVAPPIDTEKLYTCQRCLEDLPFGDFPRNAHHAAGRDYWCKPCKAAYKRQQNAERRAAEGLKPRTRRRPSDPKPDKPAKVTPIKATPPPVQPVAIDPPRKTLKERIAERQAAAC